MRDGYEPPLLGIPEQLHLLDLAEERAIVRYAKRELHLGRVLVGERYGVVLDLEARLVVAHGREVGFSLEPGRACILVAFLPECKEGLVRLVELSQRALEHLGIHPLVFWIFFLGGGKIVLLLDVGYKFSFFFGFFLVFFPSVNAFRQRKVVNEAALLGQHPQHRFLFRCRSYPEFLR